MLLNRNVLLALAAVFMLWAARTMTFVVVPLVAATIGLPGIAIGALVSILAGLGLLTEIFIAAISDRVGRRQPIIAGTVLGVAGAIALALAEQTSDAPAVIAGTLLLALAFTFTTGPIQAYLSETVDSRDAARVQGINGGVQGMSALVGALLVGVAIQFSSPQRSAVLIAGVMFLALGAGLLLHETVVRGAARGVTWHHAGAIGLLLSRPALQLSALVSLVFQSVVFVVGNSFVPLYVVDELGESPVLAGALIGIRNAAMTISSPWFGYVVGRFGIASTLMAANLFALTGVVGLALTTDPRLLFVPLAVQGIGAGFAPATANTLVAAATAPRERAVGYASFGIVTRTGGLLSGLIYGSVLQGFGVRGVFLTAVGLGGVLLIAMAVRVRSGLDLDERT